MKCYSLIPSFGDNRREAFEAGAQHAGYDVRRGPPRGSFDPERDIVLIWNRRDPEAIETLDWLAAMPAPNAAIICGSEYTEGMNDARQFAMAVGGYDGSGRWAPGDGRRWRRLRQPLRPWRNDGWHVLICSQRGSDALFNLSEPPMWAEDTRNAIAAITERPCKIRFPSPDNVPFRLDMLNAWAVVTWGANVATRALFNGIPTFLCGPHSIVEGACNRDISRIESPLKPDRQPSFEAMAWAQWTVREIATGLPFMHLRNSSGYDAPAIPSALARHAILQ